MIIHNGNIQKWFFDYVEGNLTTLELKELEGFVLDHPEYYEEFQAWKESVVNNEDDTPVFTPMASLYATIPFYETVTFRIAAACMLILVTFAGGMYISNVDDLVAEYHSNKLQEELLEREQSNLNILFSLYNKDSKKTDSYVSANSALAQTVSNSVVSNPNNLVNSVPTSTNLLSTGDSYNLDQFQYVVNENIDKNLMIGLNNDFLDNIDEHTESLIDLLDIKSRKYAFLDFKNKDGFGLANKKSKVSNSNKDKETEENLAAISESAVDGGNPNKRRKKLLDNIKYIELGLGNINDPIFISPNYNTVKINPALSGELGITRVESIYRNQWTGSNSASNYGSIYADTYFSKLKAGMSVGVNYLNGLQGSLENIELNYSYVQKFSLTKNANLSVGATYSLTSINVENNLAGTSQEITSNEFMNMNSYIAKSGKHLSNLGISSWYSGKYFYGGFNVTNLLNTSLSGSQESNQNYLNGLGYTMQIGTDYRKNISSNTVISPYVVLQKEGTKKENWAGVTFRHKAIIAGVSASDNLAAKGIVGLQGNSLRLLYGYDLSKSDYNQKYIGSHEVSLRILFGNKTNNNWSRYGK